jgi:hypothetical protein
MTKFDRFEFGDYGKVGQNKFLYAVAAIERDTQPHAPWNDLGHGIFFDFPGDRHFTGSAHDWQGLPASILG